MNVIYKGVSFPHAKDSMLIQQVALRLLRIILNEKHGLVINGQLVKLSTLMELKKKNIITV